MTRTLCALLLLAVCGSAQDATVPQRTTALFNGKDLSGWYTWLRDSRYDDPKRVFSVTGGGELRISGEEWGGLATRASFRDYHLVVEWRWGARTWGAREDKARDSGILVHGVGEDGAAGGFWLESIESQLIEGGSGDIILVAGKNQPVATARVRRSGRETYFDPNGEPLTIHRGRINWWGRSPEWKDERGFRGRDDVERPAGEWNRQEVVVRGDRMTCILNGKVVNEVYGLSHTAGKIQIQSEGAELFVRKVEAGPVSAAAPPGFER